MPGTMRTVGRRCAEVLLPLLPQALLREVEQQAGRAQGKGWGAHTVEAEVAAVRRLLGARAAAPLTVLDVGANVGEWTHAALRTLPSATVHAVEPSAAAFGHLSRRFAGEPRVRLHQLALGATDGEATLFADRAGSGLASLTQRRLDHFDMSMDLQERVEVRRFASWSAEVGVDAFDVVKLDVEGHELEVLQSMGPALEDVLVLQFEFGGCNIDTRTFWQDFWYFLTSSGFRLSRLGPKGLVPLDRYYEADETFTTTNFFAARS